MQDTALPRHFPNTARLLSTVQRHLHRAAPELAARLLMAAQDQQWWASSETGTALLLPGLGWAASGHTKQISPSSREPTTSWAEYPGDFVLFQMFFVLPLPFPLRHLLTVRHKRAGLGTARVCCRNTACWQSCCFQSTSPPPEGLQSNERP